MIELWFTSRSRGYREPLLLLTMKTSRSRRRSLLQMLIKSIVDALPIDLRFRRTTNPPSASSIPIHIFNESQLVNSNSNSNSTNWWRDPTLPRRRWDYGFSEGKIRWIDMHKRASKWKMEERGGRTVGFDEEKWKERFLGFEEVEETSALSLLFLSLKGNEKQRA